MRRLGSWIPAQVYALIRGKREVHKLLPRKPPLVVQAKKAQRSRGQVHPTRPDLEPSPVIFSSPWRAFLFPHRQRDTYHDPCEYGYGPGFQVVRNSRHTRVWLDWYFVWVSSVAVVVNR